MRASRSRVLGAIAGLSLLAATSLAVLASTHAAGAGQAPPSNPDGWQIPPNANAEESPFPATPAVLEKGRRVYESKCRRCHGPEGKGDGPDADPERMPEDLTDASRASRNPDGVMFYKVWNGRAKPKMPAFKTELSKEDVWSVVHYVKTLRQ